MKPLIIGNKVAEVPIVQGGMGVGVSLGNLAGHVAKEGGVGVISSAQIGYRDPDFYKDQPSCNARALVNEIRKAKELSEGKGLIGVNVMHALKHYKEHVKIAAASGADIVICGAGLPIDLPEIVKGYDIKIAPIVSSARCTNLILKSWLKKYNRLPDLVVIEGPKAGGHLGFTIEDATREWDYDIEIKSIIETVSKYSEIAGIYIPVIVAGGVFTHEDIEHMINIGADGVQMASRFVATYECDASPEYKQAYVKAREEDIEILQSPVGMPGRALKNAFLKRVKKEKQKVTKCYQCLAKCNPSEIPYCITEALIRAVNGDVEEGLVFVGANVGRINEIVSVHDLISELLG